MLKNESIFGDDVDDEIAMLEKCDKLKFVCVLLLELLFKDKSFFKLYYIYLFY